MEKGEGLVSGKGGRKPLTKREETVEFFFREGEKASHFLKKWKRRKFAGSSFTHYM